MQCKVIQRFKCLIDEPAASWASKRTIKTGTRIHTYLTAQRILRFSLVINNREGARFTSAKVEKLAVLSLTGVWKRLGDYQRAEILTNLHHSLINWAHTAPQGTAFDISCQCFCLADRKTDKKKRKTVSLTELEGRTRAGLSRKQKGLSHLGFWKHLVAHLRCPGRD